MPDHHPDEGDLCSFISKDFTAFGENIPVAEWINDSTNYFRLLVMFFSVSQCDEHKKDVFGALCSSRYSQHLGARIRTDADSFSGLCSSHGYSSGMRQCVTTPECACIDGRPDIITKWGKSDFRHSRRSCVFLKPFMDVACEVTHTMSKYKATVNIYVTDTDPRMPSNCWRLMAV